MNTFPAKLDNLAKTLTVVVITILIIPFLGIWNRYSMNHDYKMIIPPVLIIVVMLFTALFRPKAYLINASVLKIIQVGFSRTIPTENIESVIPVSKPDLGFGLRAFGSGGFLGYIGKFWYAKIGFVTCYITDHNKMLLVRLKNGKKLMISPDDQLGFLEAFRQAKS